MATATQIAPHYSQCVLRTMYEVTTHQTLKQMGYSGKRPHSVPLLLATVHRHVQEYWKNIGWSDEFHFLLKYSDGRVKIWSKRCKKCDRPVFQ